MSTPAAFDALRLRMAELNDLQHVGGLLFWDQRTKMPPAGSDEPRRAGRDARADRPRALRRSRGRAAARGAARPYEDSLPRDSFEASLIRVTRRDWEKATRVPPSLTAEMRRSGALGFRAWDEARAASDFSLLAPHLEAQPRAEAALRRLLPAGGRDVRHCCSTTTSADMKTAEVRAVFDELKREHWCRSSARRTHVRGRAARSSCRETGRSASPAACSTGSASTSARGDSTRRRTRSCRPPATATCA